ncbi:hypothetical protein SMICM304S_01104 [Streptomyces microflavus]
MANPPAVAKTAPRDAPPKTPVKSTARRTFCDISDILRCLWYFRMMARTAIQIPAQAIATPPMPTIHWPPGQPSALAVTSCDCWSDEPPPLPESPAAKDRTE